MLTTKFLGRVRLNGFAVLLVLGGATIAHAKDEWIELRTPRFTIWSEASESKTHDWAVEFELFCRGMDELLPVDQRSVAPANILLFRSDRRIRPWLPLENGKPTKASGYARPSRGRTLLAVSLEGGRDDVRELVYDTALQWHLTGAARELPDWLKIGLGEAFTTFVLHGSSCDVGANRPEMYRMLRVAGTLPFSQLVNLEMDSLSFVEGGLDRTRQVRAECWAATQALLFTKEGIGWEAFRKYVREAPHGGTPTQELERAFGLDAAALDRRLAAYLERGESQRTTVSFDRTAVDAGFAVRPLAGWETDLVLGALLAADDRFDEADSYLSRAFLAAPNDPRVHEERAILRFAKQDYAEAGREAQHAIDGGRASYFNHYLVAYGAIHDSDVSLDQGAPPEVLAHVLACIEANPSFEPGYVLLARIAVGGTDSKAEDLLLNAASRYGGSMQIQSTCALIAARRGDDIRAHACLAVAKALPGAEKSHNAKYLAGIEEAVARALDPMAVATRLTGTQPATELNLDTLDQAAPEVVQQFVADLDRALEHTKNPVLYYVRSRLKYRLNDIAGSLADITEAVRIAPNHWEYYSYSAEVRMRRRDFVGAIADIDAAEKLHPNFGPIYGQRGYAETMAAQLPAAIADFDRAIACEPNNAEYYTSRAFAKREKKDFDGALADLNHAIELDPKLARAYLIRAGIRSTKGDGKGALEDIGRSSTLRIEAAAASSH